jgi:drug/metabolite transporter (DMT)-like permease
MQLKYSILTFIAAAFWGLYWWPLRQIEAGGIVAGWSVVAVYLIPLVAILPAVFFYRSTMREHWRSLIFIGMAAGTGLACYATAFLYTSIVRTVLLFYMMPVWATLMAIVFLKEKNSPRRWLAMLTGFAGLTLMLSATAGSDVAMPFNIGDLIALISGIAWGAGTVLIRRTPDIAPLSILPGQYFFAVLVAVFFLLTLSADQTVPDTAAWLKAMPYLIGFYVLIVLPTLYICARAAQVLSPGRVGILMMSEVLVAGISAPLIAGETLSGAELLAAALIILAGVVEVTTPDTA